eukprot:TRINITY_DN37298_c0_g1_i1.p1 TRINITY_DN37298_c0_g1~~TRINITY_DN37298_c0_g1_i1.p1  ORF type:complete len:602 (+),score=150.71 TRINITY_DN37298_c0_g1_i1:81-1886(+)
MDPLALLSDDEDEEEAAASPEASDEPQAKRQKSGGSFGGGLSFEALKKVGYGAEDDKLEAEKNAALLSSTFSALQEQVAANRPQIPVHVEEKKKPEQTGTGADYGCDEAPEEIEVFDESAAPRGEGDEDPWAPWSTYDIAEEKGLGKVLCDAMRGAGFAAPTPVQAQAWPIICAGRDLIGVARTGSGKTLAFLVPAFAIMLKEGLRSKTGESALPVQMQKVAAGPGAYSPEVLVLAPSRELAAQIETEAKRFTKTTGIATLACYGGEGMRREMLGRLRERPEVVVGTVGRIIDFLDSEKHWFGVKTVRWLVLDEADAMIGDGLNDNIRKITCDVETPHRHTSMFSATFADDVRDLATWISRNPVEARVGMRDPLRANKDVKQEIIIVKDDYDKEGCLKNILRKQFGAQAQAQAHMRNPGKVLIFAGDPDECDQLCKKLKAGINNANIETLHANKKQQEREKAMENFKNGDSPMMIATNVAGRGLDIKDITLVINYEPPEDGQDYVHRIGRTGRAGRKGTAITLLRKGPDGRAMIYITQVMRRTGLEVPKDLIEALKQRRGRDMSLAAQALEGLVKFEKVERDYAAPVSALQKAGIQKLASK